MASLYKDYKWRMVFTIMSLLFLILLLVNLVSYSMIKTATERQIGLSSLGVAVTVSLLISADLDGYRSFLKTRDVNSEYYRRMQNYFAQIKKQTSYIKFIYTTNRLDETRTEYILDAEPIGSELYSAPGDIEEENTVTLRTFITREPQLLPMTSSPFGFLFGSSVPIMDENRKVIGVAGVDIDGTMIFSTLKNWFIVLVIMCSLLLVLIGFLLSKVSVFFLEPMLKDKLTGAYNKRYSDYLLQKCIDSSLQSKQDLSVLMLDLDHFKKVNDTYGHQFGDIVLAKTSNMIYNCLRKDDFLIRYGGEEFLVLLFNLDANIAMNVAERIRKGIEAAEIFNEKENISIKITISIGITSLQHKKMTGPELIYNADKALYKAKETRNAVAIITE